MDAQLQARLQRRLRLIEGQVSGVQRMITDDREAEAILGQLTAIQSATRAAAELILLDRVIQQVRQSVQGMLECTSDCPVCHQQDRLEEMLGEADYSAILGQLSRLSLPHPMSSQQIQAAWTVEGGETE